MRLRRSTRVGSGASPETVRPSSQNTQQGTHEIQQGSIEREHHMGIYAKPLGRRDFLRGSLAAAALAATGTLGPAPPRVQAPAHRRARPQQVR